MLKKLLNKTVSVFFILGFFILFFEDNLSQEYPKLQYKKIVKDKLVLVMKSPEWEPKSLEKYRYSGLYENDELIWTTSYQGYLVACEDKIHAIGFDPLGCSNGFNEAVIFFLRKGFVFEALTLSQLDIKTTECCSDNSIKWRLKCEDSETSEFFLAGDIPALINDGVLIDEENKTISFCTVDDKIIICDYTKGKIKNITHKRYKIFFLMSIVLLFLFMSVTFYLVSAKKVNRLIKMKRGY